MDGDKLKENTVQETTKPMAYDTLFGNRSFYSLIDKLEEHAKLKNPQLKGWDLDTYYDTAFAWMGKDEELKKKVDSLDFGTQS